MIYGVGQREDDRVVLICGLSHANLDRLRGGTPIWRPIDADGAPDFVPKLDLFVFAEESEEKMAELLAGAGVADVEKMMSDERSLGKMFAEHGRVPHAVELVRQIRELRDGEEDATSALATLAVDLAAEITGEVAQRMATGPRERPPVPDDGPPPSGKITEEPKTTSDRVADAALEAIEAAVRLLGYEGKWRCIVGVDLDDLTPAGHEGSGMSTFAARGSEEEDTEPGALAASLFMHLRAILRAVGKDVALVPMDKYGRTPDGRPVAFHDLNERAFPITVTAKRVSDDVTVWETQITGPGALEVPPLVDKHGPVYVNLILADGTSHKLGDGDGTLHVPL